MEIKVTFYDLPKWKHNLITWLCFRFHLNFIMHGVTGSLEVFI